MKRQKLFNSFWLTITTAVLATQPAWAHTVQVVSDNRNSQVAPSASPTPTSPLRPSPANDICMAETPAPNYLDPNPNPLQFPTKPEEVQIQGTQPINLQQALNLAQRNNRQLQVGALTLERSQAALREAQAGLYSTLNISSSLTRSQSASVQTQAAQPSQPGAQLNLDASSTEQGEQGRQGGRGGRGAGEAGGQESRGAEERVYSDCLCAIFPEVTLLCNVPTVRFQAPRYNQVGIELSSIQILHPRIHP